MMKNTARFVLSILLTLALLMNGIGVGFLEGEAAPDPTPAIEETTLEPVPEELTPESMEEVPPTPEPEPEPTVEPADEPTLEPTPELETELAPEPEPTDANEIVVTSFDALEEGTGEPVGEAVVGDEEEIAIEALAVEASASNWNELLTAIEDALESGKETTITLTGTATVTGERVTLNGEGIVTILRGTGFTGDMISVPSGQELTLVNITLDGGGAAIANVSGALVNNAGTLMIITGAALKNNMRISGNGGGVYNAGSLYMTGGKISGNTAQNGGGIYALGPIALSGMAVIEDNAAANGSGGVRDNGGGVFAYGALTIGGEAIIRNNRADYWGGGVYYSGSSGFVMSDSAVIEGNKASVEGGGVYASYASFTLNGGRITRNTATSGGGVYSDRGSIFISGAAEISNNEAFMPGGGIYLYSASLKLSGGKIFGNTEHGEKAGAGGIYAHNSPISLSGAPQVGSATDANAIYRGSSAIDFNGGLAPGAHINIAPVANDGIRTPVAYKDSDITNAEAGYFHYLGGQYGFEVDNDAMFRQLQLGVPSEPKVDISGDFTDPVFRAKVYQMIGKAEPEPIYANDFLRIEEFDSGGYTSLAGLHHFVDLKVCYTGGPRLTSLPALPKRLETLTVTDHRLVSLPALPDSLKHLSISGGDAITLASLPILPHGLISLSITGSSLESLPSLPDTLKWLWCSAQLTSLPDLPEGLEHLECAGNRLTSLPALPESLVTLWCQNNQIMELPPLPGDLIDIVCDRNQLTALPKLPDALLNLNCAQNLLEELPALPEGLIELSCSDNRLTNLVITETSSLTGMNCSNNQLTSLLVANSSLKYLNCSNNRLMTLDLTGLNLNSLNCSYNYFSSIADIIGFNSWNGSSFVFEPQLEAVPVTGVTLDKTVMTLTVGGTETLTATVMPPNATNQTVTWSSDDETIATVNENGVVTAVAAGTATITATTVNGNKTAICEMTVTDADTPICEIVETGIQYVSLEDAMAAYRSDQTIRILRDLNYTSPIITPGWPTEPWEAFVLDLNGHTMMVDCGTGIAMDMPPYDALCFIGGGTLNVIGNVTGVLIINDGIRATIKGSVNGRLIATEPGTTVELTGSVNLIGNDSYYSYSAVWADAYASIRIRGNVTARGELFAHGVAACNYGTLTIDGSVLVESDREICGVTAYTNGIVTVGGNVTVRGQMGSYDNTIGLRALSFSTIKVLGSVTMTNRGIGAVAQSESTITIDGKLTSVDWYVRAGSLYKNYGDNDAVSELPGYIQYSGEENEYSGSTNRMSYVWLKASENTGIPATGVTLSADTFTLRVGESRTLSASVTPYNATNQVVVWSSSDERVATIAPSAAAIQTSAVFSDDSAYVTAAGDGVVKAVGVGTTIITATTADGGWTANCTVTVPLISVTGLSLNKFHIPLTAGTSETLIATVEPANATNKTVTWSSSNTAIARVNNSGVVTAVSPGDATITATTADGGWTRKCEVTVRPIGVSGVTLDKNTMSLAIGGSEALTATVAPANAANKAVLWFSNDVNIATVDANGLVSAVGVGTATITVRTEDSGRSATCDVTVTPVAVTGVTLNQSAVTLILGAGETLAATVAPGNATDKGVSWSTSNAGVATVDEKGYVTAVGRGAATITARTNDGGMAASCAVTVIYRNAGSFQPKSIPTKQFKLTHITVQNVPNAVSQTMTSSNQNIAVIEGNTVVFVGTGKVAIKVTHMLANAKKATTVTRNITVQSKVSGVSLNNTSVTVVKRAKATLTAIVAPPDATNKAVTWTTSNKKVATVTSKGVVTGVGAGTCTITVTTKDGSFKQTATVSVIPIYETGMKLSKTNASLAKGKTVALKATFTPANTDFKTVTWHSDDEAVAIVNAKGVVRAVQTGTCTITATSANGYTARCTITTLPQRVTSVKFGAVPATQLAGASINIPFIVAPATADNLGLTWTSSNPAIATVVDGKVTFLSGGKVTIKATAQDDSGRSASRAFTVRQPVGNIALNATTLSLAQGATSALAASVTPTTATNRAVAWTTSDRKVATVSSSGMVKGVAPGTATITATARDGSKIFAQCTVAVQ